MKMLALTGISLLMVTLMSANSMAHEIHNEGLVIQFRQLDRNVDGFISAAESTSRPELTRYMNLSVFGGFEMADINNDGRLDMAEFLASEEDLPAE